MILHQEHLQTLCGFCRKLCFAIEKAGLKNTTANDVFRAAIAGECVQCAMTVTGDELFAICLPKPDAGEDPRIRRLRLGDCAKPGCNSCYYRLSFYPLHYIDWSKLLLELPTEGTEQRATPLKSATSGFCKHIFDFPGARKVSLALAVILLLLVAHQWYRGGRIPLIHEPEHFHVDYAPEETPGPSVP